MRAVLFGSAWANETSLRGCGVAKNLEVWEGEPRACWWRAKMRALVMRMMSQRLMLAFFASSTGHDGISRSALPICRLQYDDMY